MSAVSDRRRAALPGGSQAHGETGPNDPLAIDVRLVDQLEILVRPHDADLDRQISEDFLEAIRTLPRIAVYVWAGRCPEMT